MDNKNNSENIVIIDCGSQFTQLIARRVRELKIYSVILPWDAQCERVKSLNPAGIIISGGPDSVNDDGAISIDENILKLDLPVLGICYGMQLLTKYFGGEIASGKSGHAANVNSRHAAEYGVTEINILNDNSLFQGLNLSKLKVLMSHGDYAAKLPDNFKLTAETSGGVIAAIENPGQKIFGLQFHPEVAHTEHGTDILRNFLFNICGCSGSWNLEDWVENTVKNIRDKVGTERVVCGLSGGVDSSVAAALVSKAVGSQLECILVDHGLMRLNEAEQVMESYKNIGLSVRHVDASELFLNELKGVTDPERKRRIIGKLFIDVFDEEAGKIGNVNSKSVHGAKWLLQGTIYPDVIESGSKKGSALIKSHHNVGGLPENMDLKLLEPLRDLFKDEVREIGRIIGVPENIINRQPFPGPGLAVRCLGEINKTRLDTLRAADAIFTEELKNGKIYNDIWQSFCVLLPVKSVGVMGDSRTYNEVIVLRAIHSQDAMTADWVKIPYEILDKTAKRICNEVSGVNRVVMDVTSKPPATIEWE